MCLEAGDLRESEYNRGTGCGNTARPGLGGAGHRHSYRGYMLKGPDL